jgi:hypothetical protein
MSCHLVTSSSRRNRLCPVEPQFFLMVINERYKYLYDNGKLLKFYTIGTYISIMPLICGDKKSLSPSPMNFYSIWIMNIYNLPINLFYLYILLPCIQEEDGNGYENNKYIEEADWITFHCPRTLYFLYYMCKGAAWITTSNKSITAHCTHFRSWIRNLYPLSHLPRLQFCSLVWNWNNN